MNDKNQKSLILNRREISDLENLAIGAYRPLDGFMCKGDYFTVLKDMRLSDGQPWSIPITLSVSYDEAEGFDVGEEIRLNDQDGNQLADLLLNDKYTYDRELEAEQVYRTKDERHPGVKALYGQGEILLGGKVSIINRPYSDDLVSYRIDPGDAKRLFKRKGWRSVVGFQTRNPVHRAHEYIQKCAMEVVDGLFFHPLVGETKAGDIPAKVRMRCYEVLIERYYPGDRVVLGVNPAAMRYAGPREAIFHAIVRRNYGCTHFIVGRDHAGVGNYYGPYDAQQIFSEFAEDELGITPLFFDNAFYCRRCGNYATFKTCPHPSEERLDLSGTQIRELLAAGELPPPEFTRPEVAKILIEEYQRTGCQN
ncbi:MAG: sulfate adenylyltransferase [Actinobacteria bacterium]|nr:sulfate adenylyltransferase [Actinomycetota bacterium]